MRLLLWICGGCLLAGFISCRQSSATDTSETGQRIPVTYARGLLLESFEGYTHVTIRHPQDTDLVIAEYFLYKGDSIPTQIKEEENLIRVPVENIVCLSTTHVGMLEALDATDLITAMSGTRWVYNEDVRNRVERGEIKEIGLEGGLNKELLIQLQPDVVLGYVSGIAGYDEASGLQQLGLPVVLIQEFTELHPLGMAEWVRLVALLLDEPDLGDTYFDELASRYRSLSQSASERNCNTVVMTGLPFRGEWTVSGGRSFAAQYIRDAGAGYLWEDNDQTGNFPVSLEEVLLKAEQADVWLNPGAALTRQDILNTDHRLDAIRPITDRRVYNNQKRVHESGGNDYWESAVVHPDDVLYDLIRILCPDTADQDTALNYYQWLP